jgi:hypothetical protein
MTPTLSPAADGVANNPFVVESPEKLASQQIVDLFVSQYTQIDSVRQRKHTLIWGTRGSGKSMMLRYLEPRCQSIVAGDAGKFLEGETPSLAIYCPCKEGQFNKTELLLLDANSSQILSEHLLNLSIGDRIANCCRTQFPPDFFTKAARDEFAKTVPGLFDRTSIRASLREASERVSKSEAPFQWLEELFASEIGKISKFLRSNSLHGLPGAYDGATSGYHDFLLPLVRAVQRLFGRPKLSLYLLIDDADKLPRNQQSIINTWIANRDQQVLCIKVCAQRDEYRTFHTTSGSLIEQPHDYSEIDVDELYTNSKSDYFDKVKLIAERRLGLAALPTQSITEFLPADPGEQELLEQMKVITAKEWEEVGQPGTKSDFVDRYATARLFQHLSRTKKRKSYAGFHNLVHLSSGVVRDFLDPCYLMFDDCLRKGQRPDQVAAIPPNIQNDIIFRYSEDLLLMKFEDIRKDLPPEQWGKLKGLRTLIESLGRMFYQRLHDPQSREARLFSFTVRGAVPEQIEEILRLGVRYRYFQHRTYSSKEGGGRENWYILSRRLCPVFKLDPTGFEGRISLTVEDLILACEDPQRFLRRRLRSSQDADQPNLFSVEEEDQ